MSHHIFKSMSHPIFTNEAPHRQLMSHHIFPSEPPHLRTLSHHIFKHWATTSSPMSHHIFTNNPLQFHQWATTSSNKEPPHLYKWATTSLPMSHHIFIRLIEAAIYSNMSCLTTHGAGGGGDWPMGGVSCTCCSHVWSHLTGLILSDGRAGPPSHSQKK